MNEEDSRPSIVELQRATGPSAAIALHQAIPVLLEIAAAALAFGPELVYMPGPRRDRLMDAIAKVRR